MSPDQPITVSVDVDLHDYKVLATLALERQHAIRNWRITYLMYALMIAAAALVPPAVYGDQLTIIHTSFIALALTVAVLGWRSTSRFVQSSVYAFSNSSDSRAHLGQMVFHFTPEGLSSHSPLASNWYSWQFVSHIDETDSYLFIHVGLQRAFILPRHKSRSEVPWPQLVAALRTLRSNAKNFAPHCPQCGFNLQHIPLHGCPECGWSRSPHSSGAA